MTGPDAGRRLLLGFWGSWEPKRQARIRAICPSDFDLIFLTPENEADALTHLDVLVVGTDPVPPALIDRARRLRLIQRWGTGFDNVDSAMLRRRGIAAAELPGVNARSVSEFILLAVLSLLRHLPDIAVAWSRGAWSPDRANLEPRRLQGKTLGLLGFGAIGRDLARLLQPFEVEIIFHDLVAELPAGVSARPVDKATLLARSDIVTVQLPLDEATRGTIGVAEIECMKRSAVLVSVSRAGVVDEVAVREAVREGRLAAASFDNHAIEPLPSSSIVHQPGILATPHVGGASNEGFEALIHGCFASIRTRVLGS